MGGTCGYSNEIATPLKNFQPGEEVLVEAHDKTLLGVAYVNPHSLISARLFSRNPNSRLDVNFFVEQIKTACDWRDRLFVKPYYRLIFGESDNLPGLVVDRYGDHLAVQLNTAGMEAKKNAIIESLKNAIPSVQSILLRIQFYKIYEGLETSVTAGGARHQKKFVRK